jgi:hypothetical protein
MRSASGCANVGGLTQLKVSQGIGNHPTSRLDEVLPGSWRTFGAAAAETAPVALRENASCTITRIQRTRLIRADCAVVAPSPLACFEDDFEACVAHLRLPVTHRRMTRTTNLLVRLFGEERRRLKIAPDGFAEKPVLKLMFGALIRAAERWRGLRFTEFELRQIAMLRKEFRRGILASIMSPARSDRAFPANRRLDLPNLHFPQYRLLGSAGPAVENASWQG